MSVSNESAAEALRLLGIAEKLLADRDLSGAREFAFLAQETDLLLDGSDQILAVADVLVAADRRASGLLDLYAILDVDQAAFDNIDLIKKSYRHRALLLRPDRNRFPLAGAAFQIVADAWAVLSDPTKKANYDAKLGLKARNQAQHKPHKKRDNGAGISDVGRESNSDCSRFWTMCPYCYVLYEYPVMYRDSSMRCQSCRRTYHGSAVTGMPPVVPGKEAYYCCWGLFPLGFESSEVNGNGNMNFGFANCMPPMVPANGGNVGKVEVEAEDGSEEEEEEVGVRVRRPMWRPAPKMRGQGRARMNSR
ncbi:hypothetical protein Droror1_Dr00011272 [Drosera rotundifolia]